jgi:DNA polymerase elongation subunit (family B)
MSRSVQIYHLSSTDTEQVAWCLDANSDTVCIRTPLVFSVIVEALSVDNPTRATITDRSRNIVLTEAVFKKFLSERKIGFRGLSISSVEAVQLTDIYFFQGGHKKPYLRVFFSSLQGFQRFRNLFQGKAGEDEELPEVPNDDDLERVAVPVEEEESALMKQHSNVMLVTDGVFARFRILESDIAPYWHWLIHHKILAASTVVLPIDANEIPRGDPTRLSNAVREYNGVSKLELSPQGDLTTHPKVLSWDIESLSENPAKFPNACAIGDVAFFISAYIKRYGDPDSKSRRVGIYLVDSLDTLGLTEPRLADGTELIIVPDEAGLLDAFWNLIREEQPQILIGYNTMGFDSRYLHHKMSIYQKNYPNLSLMRDEHCPNSNMRQFSWSSSAYKAVECWYYDTPGMLVLDMFVELKRDAALSLKAYTLDAVSEHFLNEHKVDLKAREMFNIYLQYQRGVRNDKTRREMRLIAEYGMQDAVLPARLFDLRTQWIIYTQMACIMGLGVMDLITRGQTLRTKANIYRMCRELGFVINVPRDKPMYNGKFRGAYVCNMKAGLYNNVIVYDFASLYPSIISAFNLCYSTFIHPRDWAMFPASTYNSFQVTIPGSEETREVRYVKACVFKGIMPRVVEGFLSARAATREELKKTRDPILKVILNQKQLAIKVSNNSVYGAVSSDFSSKGAGKITDICLSTLGLKWIGMTVTEIGQTLIKGCTSFLQKKYQATSIYGDTDSTFFTLPDLPAPTDGSEPPTLWSRAEKIAAEFNETLPPPLKIELEKIIRMIGLTAKRYIYRLGNPDGTLQAKLNYKGVVATRRDTCGWQVKLFSAVSAAILQDQSKDEVTRIAYRAIIELLRGRVPLKELLIGSSVAESYKAATCRMAVLKNRMAELGRPIAGGSRVEFFITQLPAVVGPMDALVGRVVHFVSPYTKGPKGGFREANVSARVRMMDEFVEGVTKIDYAFYVGHMAQKSIDQLFSAAYHGDTVVEPLLDGLYFRTEKTLGEMEATL